MVLREFNGCEVVKCGYVIRDGFGASSQSGLYRTKGGGGGVRFHVLHLALSCFFDPSGMLLITAIMLILSASQSFARAEVVRNVLVTCEKCL